MTYPLWTLPWEWLCLKVMFSWFTSPCFIKFSLAQSSFPPHLLTDLSIGCSEISILCKLCLEIPLSSTDAAKANVFCGLISLPLHWHWHYPLPLQELQLFRGSVFRRDSYEFPILSNRSQILKIKWIIDVVAPQFLFIHWQIPFPTKNYQSDKAIWLTTDTSSPTAWTCCCTSQSQAGKITKGNKISQTIATKTTAWQWQMLHRNTNKTAKYYSFLKYVLLLLSFHLAFITHRAFQK